jgi:hypothetical protein
MVENVPRLSVLKSGVSRQAGLWIMAFLLWGVAVVTGFNEFVRYETTSGDTLAHKSHWPADSTLILTPGRFNIVMLAHPRCPCTRASLDELQELLARNGNKAVAHVLFWMPPDADEAWRQTDLWRRAAANPNVHLHADENGVEARRFGAATSGHVVVYDQTGRLQFSGGLTNARGRSGDSIGSAAIDQIIAGKSPPRTQTSVFGCRLFVSNPASAKDHQSCQ